MSLVRPSVRIALLLQSCILTKKQLHAWKRLRSYDLMALYRYAYYYYYYYKFEILGVLCESMDGRVLWHGESRATVTRKSYHSG